MHPAIANLLELHDVNLQRQLVTKGLRAKQAELDAAQGVLDTLTKTAEAAEGESHKADALLRQYQGDIERCDSTIEELRGKQMEAKSNKEYLAIINGVEEAKNEKKLRAESITNLEGQVEGLQANAAAASAKRDEQQALVDGIKAAVDELASNADSAAELDRIYNEKKTAVDSKFLAHYERLVTSGHRMPLMRVDGLTRATPYGNMVSTNQLEHIRLGELVIDQGTNAILYVDEGPKVEDANES